MPRKKIARRQFIALSAAASATMIAAPFVRTAKAAGKLSIGFWDHWVPGANDANTELVDAWAAKEHVDVQIDYITSQGFKNLLTIAAEAPAVDWYWPRSHGVHSVAAIAFETEPGLHGRHVVAPAFAWNVPA